MRRILLAAFVAALTITAVPSATAAQPRTFEPPYESSRTVVSDDECQPKLGSVGGCTFEVAADEGTGATVAAITSEHRGLGYLRGFAQASVHDHRSAVVSRAASGVTVTIDVLLNELSAASRSAGDLPHLAAGSAVYEVYAACDGCKGDSDIIVAELDATPRTGRVQITLTLTGKITPATQLAVGGLSTCHLHVTGSVGVDGTCRSDAVLLSYTVTAA